MLCLIRLLTPGESRFEPRGYLNYFRLEEQIPEGHALPLISFAKHDA
jgi:hypothetical protein